MSAAVAEQLDLFAPEPASSDEREAWRARFTRVDWTAPYDCSGGMRKGDTVLGWQCPGCGKVEVNTFLLGINHGYDPEVPGRAPFGEAFGATCTRLRLLASQSRAAAQRDERAVVRRALLRLMALVPTDAPATDTVAGANLRTSICDARAAVVIALGRRPDVDGYPLRERAA